MMSAPRRRAGAADFGVKVEAFCRRRIRDRHPLARDFRRPGDVVHGALHHSDGAKTALGPNVAQQMSFFVAK